MPIGYFCNFSTFENDFQHFSLAASVACDKRYVLIFTYLSIYLLFIYSWLEKIKNKLTKQTYKRESHKTKSSSA